jgi:hypothetical protein
MAKFEISDKAQESNQAGNADWAVKEAVLHQEPLPIKLANFDNGLIIQDSPADKTDMTAEKADAMAEFLEGDPESLSPGLRKVQELAQGVTACLEDKKDCAVDSVSDFENAIQNIDTTALAADKRIEAETPTLRPEFERHADILEAKSKAMKEAALSNIPAEDLVRMQQITNLWAEQKNDKTTTKALEAEINKYPVFSKAAHELKKAQEDAKPTMDKVMALETLKEEVDGDRVVARMVFAEMLRIAGQPERAKELDTQALAIQLQVPEEEVKKRIEQKERSIYI